MTTAYSEEIAAMFDTRQILSQSSWFRRFILLALAGVLVFVIPAPSAADSRVAFTPHTKTMVVAPVPGSPEASGKALISALKRIRFHQAADKAERLLIKLEPGVYDLGEYPLVLKPGVDIEGSGALQTEVIGLGQSYDDPDFSFHNGVVVGADDAELRHLTVRCENTNHFNACIVMSNHHASPRLTGVRLLATDAEGDAHWGLRNDESSPVLEDVEIVVANGRNNYAMVNTFSGSRPEITSSTLTAQDGTGHNVGILNKVEGLPAFLDDVEVHVIGGEIAAGIQTIDTEDLELEQRLATNATLGIVNSEISARDGFHNLGVVGGRFALEVRDSRVVADRGSALDLGPYGEIDVSGAELHALHYLAHAGNVRISSSWLRGEGEVRGYGEETCSDVRTDASEATDSCP